MKRIPKVISDLVTSLDQSLFFRQYKYLTADLAYKIHDGLERLFRHQMTEMED